MGDLTVREVLKAMFTWLCLTPRQMWSLTVDTSTNIWCLLADVPNHNCERTLLNQSEVPMSQLVLLDADDSTLSGESMLLCGDLVVLGGLLHDD